MQFIKKTRSRSSIIWIFVKMSAILVIILGIVFVLNKIEFPSPKKEIEKIIPNENFKIVK